MTLEERLRNMDWLGVTVDELIKEVLLLTHMAQRTADELEAKDAEILRLRSALNELALKQLRLQSKDGIGYEVDSAVKIEP